jgi:hypothetical protein
MELGIIATRAAVPLLMSRQITLKYYHRWAEAQRGKA